MAVAAPASAQSVQLFWDPPAENVNVSYRIEGGSGPGERTAAYPVGAGVTSFRVTGLIPGNRYYFVVRAIDAGGSQSEPSNEVSVVADGNAAEPAPPSSTEQPPSAPTAPGPAPGPAPAPAPEAPPGPTTISVASEGALQEALARLRSNMILVLAPGSYQLTRPLRLTGVEDIELRGSTGRAEDVTLIGPPPTATDPHPAAILVTDVTGVVLSGFTVREVAGYAVMLGTDVQRPTLRALRIVAAGQFVLSARHTDGDGAADGLIEGCSFEYAGVPATSMPTGVEIRGGRQWTIRGNRFLDPRARERVLFGPSLLVWQGSGGTTVERNVFIHTAREIVLGLDDRAPDQHTGGVVRNNMIVRLAGTGQRGAAISVLDSPGTIVAHNTALLTGTSSVAIDYAHPDTQNAYIANNLVDAAVVGRDAAAAIVEGNLETATATMFVAPAQGDLRLRADAAAAAIDQGVFTTYADTDAEGQPRPAGVAADIGADEVQP